MPTYNTTSEDVGQRADVVLSRMLDLSRSQMQKRIKAGEVTLNGEPIKANLPLEVGMSLTYEPIEVNHAGVPKGPTPVLDVLYEDDDVVVINKPAGLLVHPTSDAADETSVVDALFERHPDIADVGDDPMRPGIVHRLDKDVSGALIIARTQEAFDFLKTQFQERKVEKEYLALVYGDLSKEQGTIRFPIARGGKGTMIARPEGEEGKEAVTHYEVIDHYRNMTLVRVKIETGRTHQIRVHMRAIDHPVVGDKLYGKKKMTNIRPMNINRLFLHATKLGITLPRGERRTFESPLPAELAERLEKLPTT